MVDTVNQWWHDETVPLSSVSISSRCYTPCVSEESGGQTYRKPCVLLEQLRSLVLKREMPLQVVVPLFTSNAAAAVGLKDKGIIDVGRSADILILDAITLELRYVISKGCVIKRPSWAAEPQIRSK